MFLLGGHLGEIWFHPDGWYGVGLGDDVFFTKTTFFEQFRVHVFFNLRISIASYGCLIPNTSKGLLKRIRCLNWPHTGKTRAAPGETTRNTVENTTLKSRGVGASGRRHWKKLWTNINVGFWGGPNGSWDPLEPQQTHGKRVKVLSPTKMGEKITSAPFGVLPTNCRKWEILEEEGNMTSSGCLGYGRHAFPMSRWW